MQQFDDEKLSNRHLNMQDALLIRQRQFARVDRLIVLSSF